MQQDLVEVLNQQDRCQHFAPEKHYYEPPIGWNVSKLVEAVHECRAYDVWRMLSDQVVDLDMPYTHQLAMPIIADALITLKGSQGAVAASVACFHNMTYSMNAVFGGFVCHASFDFTESMHVFWHLVHSGVNLRCPIQYTEVDEYAAEFYGSFLGEQEEEDQDEEDYMSGGKINSLKLSLGAFALLQVLGTDELTASEKVDHIKNLEQHGVSLHEFVQFRPNEIYNYEGSEDSGESDYESGQQMCTAKLDTICISTMAHHNLVFESDLVEVAEYILKSGVQLDEPQCGLTGWEPRFLPNIQERGQQRCILLRGSPRRMLGSLFLDSCLLRTQYNSCYSFQPSEIPKCLQTLTQYGFGRLFHDFLDLAFLQHEQTFRTQGAYLAAVCWFLLAVWGEAGCRYTLLRITEAKFSVSISSRIGAFLCHGGWNMDLILPKEIPPGPHHRILNYIKRHPCIRVTRAPTICQNFIPYSRSHVDMTVDSMANEFETAYPVEEIDHREPPTRIDTDEAALVVHEQWAQQVGTNHVTTLNVDGACVKQCQSPVACHAITDAAQLSDVASNASQNSEYSVLSAPAASALQHCLPFHAYVWTKQRGPVEATNLRVGDEVGLFPTSQVRNIHCLQLRQRSFVDISLGSHGSLTVTSSHALKVCRPSGERGYEAMLASDLQEGDLLQSLSAEPIRIQGLLRSDRNATVVEIELEDPESTMYASKDYQGTFVAVYGSLVPRLAEDHVTVLTFNRYDNFGSLLHSPELQVIRHALEDQGWEADLNAYNLGPGKMLVPPHLAWSTLLALQTRRRPRGESGTSEVYKERIGIREVVVSRGTRDAVISAVQALAGKRRVFLAGEEELRIPRVHFGERGSRGACTYSTNPDANPRARKPSGWDSYL